MKIVASEGEEISCVDSRTEYKKPELNRWKNEKVRGSKDNGSPEGLLLLRRTRTRRLKESKLNFTIKEFQKGQKRSKREGLGRASPCPGLPIDLFLTVH
jgi:hypothetical protein